MKSFALLLRLALRNLSASFLNVIIGLILLAGTLFFVVGGSLISSINGSMRQGIVGSVAGDAQIYSAASADKPALFDNWNLPDLAPIPNFAKVQSALAKDPDIKALVPMGVGSAQLVYGNSADQALERLRKAYEARPRVPKA
ncbi:MAG: ABC transporter permease, partial [bacterium]